MKYFFNSTEEFLENFKHFDLEVKQLERGKCSFALQEACLEDIIVQVIQINKSLEHRGAVLGGYYSFGITRTDTKTVHNGLLLEGEVIVVCEPDKEYVSTFERRFLNTVIYIKKEIVEKVFFNIKGGVYKVNNKILLCELNQIIWQMFNLNTIYSIEKSFYSNLIYTKLEQILMNHPVDLIGLSQLDALKNNKFCKIVNFIEKNSEVSIGEISNMFKIKERSLRNLFIKYTGVSPKQYQKALKLHNLKHSIINNRDKNITDLIISNGLEHHSLVAKNFKDYFKMTPSELKNQIPLKLEI